MKHVLKQLIDDNVLDFSALVLKYYHKFDLTEREAIALIKLHTLLDEKEQIIKPAKFSKWLATTPKQTENILNSLVSKGYLTIALIKDDEGKECETFNVDFFLNKVAKLLNDKQNEHKDAHMAHIVEYLEDMFQKPLTQFDMEMVQAWIYDEGYDERMIQDAVKQVITRQHPTLKQVDHVLLNRLKDTKKRPVKNNDALKEFHKLWEE